MVNEINVFEMPTVQAVTVKFQTDIKKKGIDVRILYGEWSPNKPHSMKFILTIKQVGVLTFDVECQTPNILVIKTGLCQLFHDIDSTFILTYIKDLAAELNSSVIVIRNSIKQFVISKEIKRLHIYEESYFLYVDSNIQESEDIYFINLRPSYVENQLLVMRHIEGYLEDINNRIIDKKEKEFSYTFKQPKQDTLHWDIIYYGQSAVIELTYREKITFEAPSLEIKKEDVEHQEVVGLINTVLNESLEQLKSSADFKGIYKQFAPYFLRCAFISKPKKKDRELAESALIKLFGTHSLEEVKELFSAANKEGRRNDLYGTDKDIEFFTINSFYFVVDKRNMKVYRPSTFNLAKKLYTQLVLKKEEEEYKKRVHDVQVYAESLFERPFS